MASSDIIPLVRIPFDKGIDNMLCHHQVFSLQFILSYPLLLLFAIGGNKKLILWSRMKYYQASTVCWKMIRIRASQKCVIISCNWVILVWILPTCEKYCDPWINLSIVEIAYMYLQDIWVETVMYGWLELRYASGVNDWLKVKLLFSATFESPSTKTNNNMYDVFMYSHWHLNYLR